MDDRMDGLRRWIETAEKSPQSSKALTLLQQAGENMRQELDLLLRRIAALQGVSPEREDFLVSIAQEMVLEWKRLVPYGFATARNSARFVALIRAKLALDKRIQSTDNVEHFKEYYQIQTTDQQDKEVRLILEKMIVLLRLEHKLKIVKRGGRLFFDGPSRQEDYPA